MGGPLGLLEKPYNLWLYKVPIFLRLKYAYNFWLIYHPCRGPLARLTCLARNYVCQGANEFVEIL